MPISSLGKGTILVHKKNATKNSYMFIYFGKTVFRKYLEPWKWDLKEISDSMINRYSQNLKSHLMSLLFRKMSAQAFDFQIILLFKILLFILIIHTFTLKMLSKTIHFNRIWLSFIPEENKTHHKFVQIWNTIQILKIIHFADIKFQ